MEDRKGESERSSCPYPSILWEQSFSLYRFGGVEKICHKKRGFATAQSQRH